MGATIWTARDLCLFLLLLNSRQSRTLPEFRGGIVEKACVSVSVCCMRACSVFPSSALLYTRFSPPLANALVFVSPVKFVSFFFLILLVNVQSTRTLSRDMTNSAFSVLCSFYNF